MGRRPTKLVRKGKLSYDDYDVVTESDLDRRYDIVSCPLCGRQKPRTAMNHHIMKMAYVDAMHKMFYERYRGQDEGLEFIR
jgi:hypothetical protein